MTVELLDGEAVMGPMEAWALRRAMKRCRMTVYPEVTGDPAGEIAGGTCVCAVCGEMYFEHPLDWRVLGHDGAAYLTVLCDGRRVKL